MSIFVQSGGSGGPAPGTEGLVHEIRFPLGLVDASSTTSIPANAYVIDAELDVTTPYDAGTTVKIGRVGSTSLVQAVGDNNPEIADLYSVDQDTLWGATAVVLATVAGAPAAGAAAVIVRYVVPEG